MPQRLRWASARSCPMVVGESASAAAGTVPCAGIGGEGREGGVEERGEGAAEGAPWSPTGGGEPVTETPLSQRRRGLHKTCWRRSWRCPGSVGCSSCTCMNGGGHGRNGGILTPTINNNVGAIAPVCCRQGESATRLARHCGLRRIGVCRGAHPVVAQSSRLSMESMHGEGGWGKKIRRRQ